MGGATLTIVSRDLDIHFGYGLLAQIDLVQLVNIIIKLILFTFICIEMLVKEDPWGRRAEVVTSHGGHTLGPGVPRSRAVQHEVEGSQRNQMQRSISAYQKLNTIIR
jgi:hypothetical protein